MCCASTIRTSGAYFASETDLTPAVMNLTDRLGDRFAVDLVLAGLGCGVAGRDGRSSP